MTQEENIGEVSSNTNLVFYSGILYVDPINNMVGIGTTMPTQTIDVAGSANISGNVSTGNLVVSGLVVTSNIKTSGLYDTSDRRLIIEDANGAIVWG